MGMWVMVEHGCKGMFLLKVKHCMWYSLTVQDGSTPLLLAAEGGHADLVRLLAGHYEGDIFRTTKVQLILLHGFLSHTHTRSNHAQHTRMYLSPPELPECAPLGSLQGSLACPSVPLSHVRRQSAGQGRKWRELPGHCSQAKAMAYCSIPHTELPTAGGQGGDGERCTQWEMDIPGLLSALSGSPLSVWQGGADKDSALAAPSDDLPKRYFALHSWDFIQNIL